MDNGGRPSSNDFSAMGTFTGNPLTREEYLLRKAKIDEAREKLVQMELETELQEIMRQGREAEQKLARMRAEDASARLAAGPSSASLSSYYPQANYSSVNEVPLTARIDGEVQDPPPNSSRSPAQVPSTNYDYQRNYSTASHPQQASLQSQFSSQHQSTQAQPAARLQGSNARPYSRAPAFSIPGYQHSSASASTPIYAYQQSRTGQSYQQQRLSEEYWAQQSQKYAAELAATNTRPPGQTSSAGINPQATLLSGTNAPQQAHAQRQAPLRTAPSEAVPAAPSTQRPKSSTETGSFLDHQSTSNDTAQPSITKQEFIRRFHIICARDASLIRAFLSTTPAPAEWLTAAASGVDLAKLTNASAIALLNDIRKGLEVPPPLQSTSTSTSTDVRVTTVVDAPSKASATTVQPSLSPTDLSSTQQKPRSLDTKEKFLVCFHEIYQQAGVDKAADFFLRNQSVVHQEWQQALMRSLTPPQLAEMHSAWNRAHVRFQEAAKARLASSGAGKAVPIPNHVPNNIAQPNRSQTTTSSGTLARPTPTTIELPKPVPVPPRPSITRSTQDQSTSAQPSQASTSPNLTTATMSAAPAIQTTSTSATQVPVPTTQKRPSVSLAQPNTVTAVLRRPSTGTVDYGQAAAANYRPYGVPPPMKVPTTDGKLVDYVYDPYLYKYVRTDIMKGQAVPSNSSAPGAQQLPTVVPQDVRVPPTISILPATPPRKPNGTTTQSRTPQQADKSRLAKDILRSLRMDELPAVAAEEESDEETIILNELPAVTEPPQETAQSHDSSHELSQDAPQDTSLLPAPSDVPMEQEDHPQAQAAQSPIKAIATDLTMHDEPATAPGDATLLISPPPATTPIPLSTSTDQDELKRGVDVMSPPSCPLPATTPGAASLVMDQDDLARVVDGMSIAVDVDPLEPSREDENMDGGTSFPDLDEPLPPVPEPVGSSPPREQIEDVPNRALPLFLPSPSASPPPSEYFHASLPPETDDEVIIVESMLRDGPSSKRRAHSDVLVLGDGRSQTPPRIVRRKKGQKVYVLVPPPSPNLRRAIKRRKLEEGGIVSGSEEDEAESKYNDFERAFMADCKFRMVERPCQWAGCDALMNSGENLRLHLKLHAQEASSQGLYICRWQSCPRRFRSAAAMEKHLEKHSYFPLPCPLANCSEVFDEPFEAIQHEVRQRRESARQLGMKQTSNPHIPRVPSGLDPPPRTLPSYRIEPRCIRQPSISSQRHNVIGPWVLQHIFSPVEQNMRKQNAPMRLRYPRYDARPEDLENLRARPDEYDFLASLSTPPTRSVRYDDLDSARVSLALHEGLTLWDTRSESDSGPAILNAEEEGGVVNPGNDADMVEVIDGGASRSVLVEGSIVPEPETATADGMYGSQSGLTGEEEAVEMMLL